MERRVLLAVVLSSFVLVAYPAVLAKIYPVAKSDNIPMSTERSDSPTSVAEQGELVKQTAGTSARLEKPESYHRVDTQRLSAVYSDRSGGIQLLVLPEYMDLDANQPVVVLHGERLSEHLLGLLTADEAHADQLLITGYDCSFNGQRTTCRGITSEGVEVTKDFVMDEGASVIRGSLIFTNSTDHEAVIATDIVLALTTTNHGQRTSYTKPAEVVVATSDRLYRASRDAVVRKGKQFNVQPSSLGLIERHFCIVGRFGQQIKAVHATALSGGQGIQARARLRMLIAPRTSQTVPVELYAGPTDYRMLKSAGSGFAEVIKPGFLSHVGFVLLAILNGIHLVVRNYGVAIILLTIMVSIVLVPFNLMSIKSMQRMKAIQPAVEKLRVACKDNKEKFNREYMELLKKHRVNPLAGCLVPLLIQMPIFFSLLQVLSNAIELRGAQFLWIHDLSAPDRLARLPVSLPIFGNELNLLPLLTVVAMFIQQRISQASMPKTCSEDMPDMSVIMLAVFAVWMYHAPAGPVIYWLVNTVIMIAWFRIALRQPRIIEAA